MEGINLNKLITSKLNSLFRLKSYENNKDLLATLEFTSTSSINTNKMVKDPDNNWITWINIMNKVPQVANVDDIVSLYNEFVNLASDMNLDIDEFINFNKDELRLIASRSLDRREKKNQERKALELLKLLKANDNEVNNNVISELESIGGGIPKLFMDLRDSLELDFVILFLINSGLKNLILSYNENGSSSLFNRLMELSKIMQNFLTERFTKEELVQLSKCGIDMAEGNILVQLNSLPSYEASKP